MPFGIGANPKHERAVVHYMYNDNTKKVRVQECVKVQIKARQEVKCIVQGEKFLEAIYMAHKPVIGVKKISKTEYVVLSTGEIKQYELTETKQQESLNKTFTNLRYLIRTNFTEESQNQLFITLTYVENMMDEKRLYKDFDKFMKRLKYKFKEHKLEYIVVAEPQGRGAWHMHVMLKSNQPILYIDNKVMTEIWGHGRTDTERLKSDDVGSYYVAYFTDITTEAKEATSEEKSNKRKKGERLKYYPKNFKFFRCSRGIERPTIEQKEHGKIEKEYGKPIHTASYSLVREDEKIINVIQHESYKKDVKKSNKTVEKKKKRIEKD